MNLIDKETEIAIHGYDPIPEILNPTPEMIDFAIFIEDLRIDKKPFYLGPSTKKEVLTNSKDFFNRHFKLNKVPYKGNIRNKLDVLALRHIPGTELPLRIHNSLIPYIDPLKLPVSFSSQTLTECMVVENVTLIQNPQFINGMKLSFKEIILPNQISELTESSYVHEITHTQLAHIKGIIKNYYNSEVLSIFLELLNIYESKKQETLLPLQNACRLTELYQVLYMLKEHSKGIKEFEQDDLIDASKYTESIFKAYGLFTEYILGSNALKKYILNSIQNIFNGNLQLEELLDEFELTTNMVAKDNRVKKVLSI